MSGQLTWQPSGQNPATPGYLDFFDKVFEGAQLGPFSFRLWDGTEWRSGKQAPRYTLEIKHPAALRRMFWRPNQLSLGEAFIFDDFDIQGDVETSFELADHLFNCHWRIAHKLQLGRKLLRLPVKKEARQWRGAASLHGRPHTKRRDSQAVRYHYNVSNDFYRLWLDQRMVYSCAYFHSEADSLDAAQVRKLDYLCRKLRLRPGQKLLDIGCGWGGLVMHAAREYGVEALGITLSEPQADLANHRIRQAGLSDSCRVEVLDYRELPAVPQFDKLVSVGMFEHVGEAQLTNYFRKAYTLLKPGGAFLNHGITEAMEARSSSGPSFIEKYVFPDGELLPISSSLHAAEEAGFEIRDVESLREHYALTLRHWVKRLEANREKAVALTCPVTYRVWRIYMAGSAYGFKSARLGLYQTLMIKSGRQASGLPLTRGDWYRPYPDRRP